MLRLNRLTDYAVVVLAQMTQHPEQTVTAPQLSQDSVVPLPTVSKLLNLLAREGLIKSQRGASGGYALGRPAESISVADIVQAVEGPIALAACVEGTTDHCEVEQLCPMRGNWNKVNSAIRGALEKLTLADMAVTPPHFAAIASAKAEPRPVKSE